MNASTDIDLAPLAAELGFRPEQVNGVVALLDEGNTVPFITRYRKERTGNLDEEQIRQIEARVGTLRQVADRSAAILRLIGDQGKLTPELRRSIEAADSLKRLEDLYLPYRPKRRSRAQTARERGLEPLADAIWNGADDLANLDSAAVAYISEERELPTAADVLQGASDVIAEHVAEDADVREIARRTAWKTGRLQVKPGKVADKAEREYRDYLDYEEAASRIPPHRVLAVNRGEKADALRVRFTWDDDQALSAVCRKLGTSGRKFGEFINQAAADALSRLVLPAMDREVRRELTERAEAHAVGVFAKNLKNLLLQPPLRKQRVLAIDPGFRTGCKLAALDEFGDRLESDVVYVTGSDEKQAASRAKIAEFVNRHGLNVVAIGNGTACRETEEMVARAIAEHELDARYLIVSEAGASVYSTSTVAREEFPEADATERGTISIGRRLQDPLSELVKIDPQSLGVGMYQHDVSEKSLRESLDRVVESCVNFVGVDVNTASASLLKHVSGLNQLVARRVVEWREKQGRFRTRRQLLDVPGVGDATFTQAAGFLKIADGDNPLDGTWIHPESYTPAERILKHFDLEPAALRDGGSGDAALQEKLRQADPAAMAREFDLGEPTCRDIVEALLKPGRDPRSDLPGPMFRRDVLKLEDLTPGMKLKGTVQNVVDFGAFVDVGLKDGALVHISKMADRYVQSPHDVTSVGDVIDVWVISIDEERRRIALTMLDPDRQSPDVPNTKPRGSEQSQKPNSNKEDRPPANARRPEQVRKKQPPTEELPTDKREGRTPLSGFGELKRLWENPDES